MVDLLAQVAVLDDHERGLQAGDVVGLARRHQRDGALGDLRAQRGHRNVLAAVEAQLGVDLVGNDPGIMLEANVGNGLQLCAGEGFAQRVMRIAQQQCATALQRLAQGIQRRAVGAIGLRFEIQFDLVQAPMSGGVAQRRVVRHLHNDVLWRLHQGLQRHVEARLDARQENQLLGLDTPGVFVPEVGHDSLAQVILGHAVTDHRVFQSFLQGLDDHRRRGEIHVGDPHRQHVRRVAAPLGTAGIVAVEHLIKIESHAQIS
ncbi:hypothetical protein D3C78_857970 [compost metagenome]